MAGSSESSTGAVRAAGRWWVPAAIFCCALGLRLVYLIEDSHSPFFGYRGIDAAQYHEMALGLGEGTWPGERPFFWPPLYPFFLSLLYGLVVSGAAAIKVVHAMMGSASCVLVYLIARRVFGGRFVPTAAAAVCCCCGTMLYFDGQLLSASLDVLLQLLVILMLLTAARLGRVAWWFLAGLLIGLAAINRGGILLFAPVVLFWMYMVARRGWPVGAESAARPPGGRFWRSAIALLLPVALVILPVTWHNVRHDVLYAPEGQVATGEEPLSESVRRLATGRFVLIAANVGMNLYLGNHWELREINRVDHPRHFTHYRRLMDEPYAEGVRTGSGWSAYLVGRTMRRIVAEPTAWVKLMGLKVAELINGTEIPRNANLYADRQYSLVLSTLLWKKLIAFPSGLLIPLGIVGLFTCRRDWREHFVLMGCLAGQVVFVLTFFVTARYRLASLPLLAMYAAVGVAGVVGAARRGERARAVALIAALVGLVVLCNVPIIAVTHDHGAYEHHNLGKALAAEGKIDEAIIHYCEALRLNPQDADAHNNLGAVLASQGKVEQAVAHHRQALASDPGYAPGHYNLANALLKQGKLDLAILHYRKAVRSKPDYVEAHNNLAMVLVRQGRIDEAIRHYLEAVRIRPGYAKAHSNVAVLLGEQGKLERAISHYRQALRINSEDGVAHYNLGLALARVGSSREAIQHLRRALAIEADHVDALCQLAWLLATSGDEEARNGTEAVRLAENAILVVGNSDPKLLDILAAAYAEAGRFELAAETAGRALGLARAQGRADIASSIRHRLELYRAGRPFRRTVPARGASSDQQTLD